MSTRRLALLVCDDVMPDISALYGGYHRMFGRLLTASLARITSDVTFTLDGYDVVKDMAYPPDDVQYDGLLITGSRASAYQDVEWINRLVAYVKRIVAERPSMKIFGICFGHQIVARALGGSCVRNNGVWEVAVTPVELTPLGKAIFGPESDQLDVQQMHRDHVPTCPSDARLLGFTDVTPNQGMVVFDNAEVPADPASVALTSIHILTVQGHPEFTQPIMSMLLDARVGLLGEKLVAEARTRAGGVPGRERFHPDGLACDGVGRIGRAIWGVLGVV